ncbi:unnamed protein product, partial [Closterium sp. Naga37s-1]
ELEGTAISGELPRFLTALTRLISLDVSNTKINKTIPPTYGTLNFDFSGLICPMDNSSCVINQNRSSTFCKFCSTFCSTCILINGQDRPNHAPSTATIASHRPCTSHH